MGKRLPYNLRLVTNPILIRAKIHDKDLIQFLVDCPTQVGFKGLAIFVVDGKPQRIPLTPAGENRLSGTSSVALPASPKGAVQITIPSGSTLQAKF